METDLTGSNSSDRSQSLERSLGPLDADSNNPSPKNSQLSKKDKIASEIANESLQPKNPPTSKASKARRKGTHIKKEAPPVPIYDINKLSPEYITLVKTNEQKNSKTEQLFKDIDKLVNPKLKLTDKRYKKNVKTEDFKKNIDSLVKTFKELGFPLSINDELKIELLKHCNKSKNLKSYVKGTQLKKFKKNNCNNIKATEILETMISVLKKDKKSELLLETLEALEAEFKLLEATEKAAKETPELLNLDQDKILDSIFEKGNVDLHQNINIEFINKNKRLKEIYQAFIDNS